MRFLLVSQFPLQSIHSFQQSLQYVCLRSAFLRNSIYKSTLEPRISRNAQSGTGLTINTRALEDLACLASRSQPIALDLENFLVCRNYYNGRRRTFRFLHDLQFIDSRGSLLMRRAGNRSMPTCAGLPDMVLPHQETREEGFILPAFFKLVTS
jgi:hypothetical protein